MESLKTTLTADQLAEKGKQLQKDGHIIVYLYPLQEWMAVKEQMPFCRYEKIPHD